jgi:hypothetical protein
VTEKTLKIKFSNFKEKGIKFPFPLGEKKTKLFSPLKKTGLSSPRDQFIFKVQVLKCFTRKYII